MAAKLFIMKGNEVFVIKEFNIIICSFYMMSENTFDCAVKARMSEI